MKKSIKADVKGLIAQIVITIPVFRSAMIANLRVKVTIRNMPIADKAPIFSHRKMVQLNLPLSYKNLEVLLFLSLISLALL